MLPEILLGACDTRLSGRGFRSPKQGDGGGGDGLAAANGVKLLVGLGLHRNTANIGLKQVGEGGTYGGNMGSQARLLGGYRAVEVEERAGAEGRQIEDLLEELLTVCIAPGVVAVREELTDVAEGEGTKQGVNDGMEQDIGVGMSQ